MFFYQLQVCVEFQVLDLMLVSETLMHDSLRYPDLSGYPDLPGFPVLPGYPELAGYREHPF